MSNDTDSPQYIPPATCELGYTHDQLETILGDRLPEFSKWMYGQTREICDGRRWNYQTREYEPTDCGPHGMIVHGSDLRRFLAGLPNID